MNRPKESGFSQRPFSEEEFLSLPPDIQKLIDDLSEIDLKNPAEILEMTCRLDYQNTILRQHLSQIQKPLNYKIMIILSERIGILNSKISFFRQQTEENLFKTFS